MPSGVYERTEEHRHALEVNRVGSGKYIRTEEINRLHRVKHNVCIDYGEKHKVKHKVTEKWKISLRVPKSEKAKQNMRIVHNSPEVKTNHRLAVIKRIEQNYGICWPSYNKEACEYFKKFDEEYNTKGRYAVYGSGEYQVKELGYFLDYINFDLKLIMEYDEEKHYINGELRERDKIRQQEIQELFPDFEFRRIKEVYNGFI